MITNEIIPHLLDVLPFVALVLLAAAFLWGRHRCRREEITLRQTIEAFRNEEASLSADEVIEVSYETENKEDH